MREGLGAGAQLDKTRPDGFEFVNLRYFCHCESWEEICDGVVAGPKFGRFASVEEKKGWDNCDKSLAGKP